MSIHRFIKRDCRLRKLFLFAAYVLASLPLAAQSQNDELRTLLEQYFANYTAPNFQPNVSPRLAGFTLDDDSTLTVEGDATFASQPLTDKIVESIYRSLHNSLPDEYKACKLVVLADGKELSHRIPNPYREKPDKSRQYSKIKYDGKPWTFNSSKPYLPTRGLQGRHLSICASHGKYYNVEQNTWQWQRPHLFCTTEDLLTQSFVVPFLIPMLENAGAIVYSPRERDSQIQEVIADNDLHENGTYEERNVGVAWINSSEPGFANTKKMYVDDENPFKLGTARQTETTNDASRTNEAAWIPDIPASGDYSVYVSYQTLQDAIDKAQYTVYHCGIATRFSVNQKMGGGTWVYLGTFRFEKGQSRRNCVTLSNYSGKKGVVSADAVRFGGGMGNMARGFDETNRELFTSGLPRYLEGARYSAQWAGMPYTVYASYGGTNDYKDDINARSYATNYLAGGSPYLPADEGKKVPIELCLAVHSDAGYNAGRIVGTLGVCTTTGAAGEKSYPTRLSREVSNDFAQMLIDNVTLELSKIYNVKWSRREVYDRMYSESCRPDVPSAIIETLSHQNFADMIYAHNPKFKFNLARSIYKGILRFLAFEHNEKYVVAPLPPDNLSVEFVSKDEVLLRWDAVTDSLESSSQPSGYIVYTRIGNGDFDNGVYVKKLTSYRKKLKTGVVYGFRVTAVNRGGESFPSETLAACRAATEKRAVLIVNCFDRLAGPSFVNTPDSVGFCLDDDLGVPFIQTSEYSGLQRVFDPNRGGDGSSAGLGNSGSELEGKMIAGNTFDFVAAHGKCLAHEYSFVSCSRKSIESGRVELAKYPMLDLLFGLEKFDYANLEHFKTFTPRLRSRIETYMSGGGSILVSGAYVTSDMTTGEDYRFMREYLHCSHAGTDRNVSSSEVKGMNMSFNLIRNHNSAHYAVTSADKVRPLSGAQTIFHYSDGSPAGIAFRASKNKAVVLGFPLECIEDESAMNKVMLNVAHYLMSE